jgi:nucleoid-associated protein YgaU
VTRELKLALIIGVTLLLGVAVLISDELATSRRVKATESVQVQPALVPPAVSEPEPEPQPEPQPEASREASPKPAVPKNSTPRLALDGTVEGGTSEVTPEGPETIVQRTGRVASGLGKLPPAARLNDESTDALTVAGETFPRPTGPAARWAVSPDDVVPQSINSQSTSESDAATRTHTIVSGDSAYKVARQYLGDGKYWKMIVDANPKVFGDAGSVKIGATVVIPELPQARISSNAPQRTPPQRTAKAAEKPAAPQLAKAEQPSKASAARNRNAYTVRKGDTLSSIARNQLGSTARAAEIMRLNQSLIKDPDSLPLGLAIVLPEKK